MIRPGTEQTAVHVAHRVLSVIACLSLAGPAAALSSGDRGVPLAGAVGASPLQCTGMDATSIRHQLQAEVRLHKDTVATADSVPMMHAMSVVDTVTKLKAGGEFGDKMVHAFITNNSLVASCMGKAVQTLETAGTKLRALDTDSLLGVYSRIYGAVKDLEPSLKGCLKSSLDYHIMIADFDHSLPMLPVFLSHLMIGSDNLVQEMHSTACSCSGKDYTNCGHKMGKLLSEHFFTPLKLKKESFLKTD